VEIEGILAILLIFGGGTLIGLSMSPIGQAIAARIRGGAPGGADRAQAEELKRAVESSRAALDEVDGLRRDLTDMQERLDFAERMLARQREGLRLPGQDA
jgi:hypothetical protein